MGAVYEAKHSRLDRTAAIVPELFVFDREPRERLEREAKPFRVCVLHTCKLSFP